MALNAQGSSKDSHWTGHLRVAPKTNDAGTPVAAGIIPPKLTSAQRDALTENEAGTVIYNTTTNKLNVYNGTAWEAVTSA